MLNKKSIFVFALVFSIGFLGIIFTVKTYARTATPSCASEEEINVQIQKCQNAGQSYTVDYDSNKCKYVKCVAQATNTGEPKPQPTAVEPKPQPTAVEPKPQTTTTETPKATSLCPSQNEIEKSVEVCKMQGLVHQYLKDANGCSYVKCLEKEDCPDIQKEIEKCKKIQKSYTEYVGQDGCKRAQCQNKEEKGVVACKKAIFDKGCVQITCDDGYYFNSCTQQSRCRIECKTTTDENGCFVKVCSDGSETRDCPKAKKEIKCEVTKTPEGCEKKICTDGYEATYCPSDKKCKVYKDKEGCKVKECADGYKNRDCPSQVQEKELECKVYVDERNCKIKVCSNGLKIDYCAAPSCKVEKDTKGCNVKTCDDGYVSKICPKAESVECKIIKDETTGCQIKKCSDGFETKECPASAGGVSAGKNAPLTAAPAPTQGMTSMNDTINKKMGNFLKRLFGK